MIETQTINNEQRKKDRLKTAGILLLSFGLSISLVIYIARHKTAVEDFIRRLGMAGPLVSIALYGVLGASPIPADPLTLINGAVFGPLWGGLIAWVGTTSAAVVEYFIGTRIGDAANFEKVRDNLPFGLGDLPADSVLFLLGGRMLTGAGSKAVSFISGIYRISLWRYIWTTAISTLFGAVLFALGGFGLLSIF
ncbi:MAG: TVP38/TMEM64 family protein [Anaerolineae bacterium]|nr:TVP38/TMEM64 family protein [Anaerolineae bacterium]